MKPVQMATATHGWSLRWSPCIIYLFALFAAMMADSVFGPAAA